MLRETYHVTKLEVLAHFRSRRLLVVFVASVYLGHVVTVGGVQLVFGDGQYRGVYNAAWIGTVTALTASAAIGLFGFYLVKNAVARDRGDGPGRLVASTPVGNLSYLLGKWLGNVVVLVALAGVLTASGTVLFLLRGTGPANPWDLLAPFVILTCPVAVLVAAVALLFETVPFLRGSVGNVAYFFALAGLLATPLDPLGGTFVVESMEAALSAQYPTYDGGEFAFGRLEGTGDLRTFVWDGLDVTAAVVRHRLTYLVVAVVVAAAAVLPFDRFDPDTAGGFTFDWLPGLPTVSRLRNAGESAATDEDGGETPTTVPALDADTTSVRPDRLLVGELRMALRGRSPTWYLGGIGLVLAGSLVGLESARRTVLVGAWLWPTFVWSEMGTREHRHHTGPLVFSSSNPFAQLGATWIAGLAVASVFVGPVALRLLATGAVPAGLGVLAGVVFVPSFALAAGVLSGTSRTFQVGYLVLWYLGPANAVAALDYGGVTDQPAPTVVGYAVAAAVLLGTALLVRRRRVR